MRLPFIETSRDQFLNKPISSIRHRRLASGGVALGIRLPHACCDSEGYFQFVSDLPMLTVLECRTFNLTSRAWGIPCLPTRPTALSLELYTADRLPEPPPTRTTLPPVTGRVLLFFNAALATLKQKHAPKSGPGWVLTFDALTAHLYDHMRTARGRAELPPLAYVVLLVNLRPTERLGPLERYFHNALLLSWLPVAGTTAETVFLGTSRQYLLDSTEATLLDLSAYCQMYFEYCTVHNIYHK